MESEKEKMLSGKLYTANDEELIKDRARAKFHLKQLNIYGSSYTHIHLLFPHAHPTLYIEPPFHCDYGYNITCGENVYFNANCIVLDVAKVSIGANVFFGPAVQLYTATHPLDYLVRRTFEFGKPITIGNDCWIGGGSIILPGITIGDRCIVGAGSVVTKNVPDDTTVIGNPARKQN